MKIGELLLEAGLVDEAQIEAALENREGLRLGSALIAARVVEPDVIARTLAQQLGVPPVKSADLVSPSAVARAMVPDALCKRLWAVPYAVHGAGNLRVLEVAMRDPENQGAINELKIAAGMRIDARVAPELLLREALHPRADLSSAPAATPTTGRMALITPTRGSAAMSTDDDAEPGPDLELDDRARGPALARRAIPRQSAAPANAAGITPTTPPRGLTPAAATAPGATTVPLPPLQYDETSGGAIAGKIFKWVFILAMLAAAGYVILRFKKCMTPTTKAVGTHYDSKLLGLGIDFPDAGWRVSFNKMQSGDGKMEFFYRGGVPEMPVVAMALGRGPADDLANAARRIFEDLLEDTVSVGCEPSTDRAGAIVCRGAGALTLFGRKHREVAIDVHVWPLSTGELVMATWINPDRTLSETQFILSSIVEQ